VLDAPFGFRQNPRMDSDEREIYHYLKTWGAEYVGTREICRRAGSKKRFHEDPDWAKPVLISMKERGIVESDALGRYRIKPVKKKKGGGRWIAPDIEKILKESGVEVDSKGSDLGNDEYYEQL
jgi:hypothetical protein